MQAESGRHQAARTSVRTRARSRAMIDPGAAISSTACARCEARGGADGHALARWLEAEAQAQVDQGVDATRDDKGRLPTAAG